MSGWVPLPADAWPFVADALPTPWPREAVYFDLRWWADQERMGEDTRPGRKALGKRWGWTDWRTRDAMRDEAGWGDPVHSSSPPTTALQPTSSPPPVAVRTKGHNGQETSSPPTTALQPASSQPPHARVSTQDTEHSPLATYIRAALMAAGHDPEHIHSMPRSACRRLGGIGPAAIAALDVWIGLRGLEWAPEPARPARTPLGPEVRELTDIWARVYVERYGGKYTWTLDPGGEDRKHAAQWPQACHRDGARFEAGVREYFAAAAAGRTWPTGQPPTVRHFTRDAAVWLAPRARHVPPPEPEKPYEPPTDW